MKKVLIIDSCDFFSLTLKQSLLPKLPDDYTVSIQNNFLTNEIKNYYFDCLVFGINNNTEEEFIFIRDIKKNYYHANILIVAQELTIEGINRLKKLGISAVFLKPVNINKIVERIIK
ncbi:MAG: hypothetical protein PHF25_05610 [Candidatus Margulisbacteria bacterium]|nr:hypothetical protein [Candidatus Margulisiibacteriota bacterium]